MFDPTLLVLSSLADFDKHGYAMMEDIEAFAGVRLGPGTLYGAITRLVESGWIRPLGSKDRRRPYRLTAQRDNRITHRQPTLRDIEHVAPARMRVVQQGGELLAVAGAPLLWIQARRQM